ncbi:MAG: thermonuclease family protein [Rhodospirillales bacterium]|nr:thermonuclease family protein [Rhodospirillales bacterium]
MVCRLFLLILGLGLVSSVQAQTFPSAIDSAPGGHVVEIVDGDTLVLSDGAEVRLVGIMVPKLALGRDWMTDEPLAQDAKDALETLVLGRDVILVPDQTSMDRHGRLLAHVLDPQGVWVQAALLEAGLARVYSFADNRVHVADMLEHEASARGAARGLWSDPYFAVRDAGLPNAIPVDRFELVEGVVADVAEVDRRIYINFGDDWRTDMTVTVSPHNRGSFLDAPLDVLSLEGARIRVRGWTSWYNGPMIEIDHPETIEVLE